MGMVNLFLPCQGSILQGDAVCPWAYRCLLWWDCASKPSGACSSPSCLLSLGKMLLGPVELDQDPRGRGGGHLGILGKERQTALARKQQFSEKMPTQ